MVDIWGIYVLLVQIVQSVTVVLHVYILLWFYVLILLWYKRNLLILLLDRFFLILFLVYQGKAIIVVEFGDCKVYFQIISELLVAIDLFKEAFGKRTDDWFFIVTYHVLEKLIDELDFEVSQVESSVIIAVILIGEIEYDFVFFILIHRVQELVNQAIC